MIHRARRSALEQRREEIRHGMVESMKVLDSSPTASVAALTGLSAGRIDQFGGAGDLDEE
ncbi:MULTISPECIES: hypothetical protein [Protofrankia]|uniref:Uncharacterized protein n=1 Tax=Protofrankia coriariae TaxID=1562887 RepID=A0ABR5F8R2_9ACTN|nr:MULTISPECIES: hypothetical protein [Protofrankia]KLL13119.1 hypothetical protein FrCorBMG51_01050 [Protofrankia coriariae]